MSKEKFTLSAPWMTYYRKLIAIFGKDPDIRLFCDLTENVIKFYVTGELKADAISRLLPGEKTFGNVTVKIEVIPANDEEADTLTLFERAFAGNPALSYVKKIGSSDTPFVAPYVVFAKEVVQFFNDDISDVNGYCSTLYENIASEVFDAPGINFCTDITEDR